MLFKNITFSGSYTDPKAITLQEFPIFAFAGRSNVGKSSFINMLFSTNLAKTSNTPGKTQTLNAYTVDDNILFVDLPGYGFARVSKKLRSSWGEMNKEFLSSCQNLKCLFLVLDLRIQMQEIDLNFMIWLGENQIPFSLAFTKSDKLSNQKIEKLQTNKVNSILEVFTEMPPHFTVSSKTGKGKTQVLNFIENNL